MDISVLLRQHRLKQVVEQLFEDMKITDVSRKMGISIIVKHDGTYQM
jgi:hypothetical protein